MPMDIRAYFSKTPPSTKTPASKPLENSSGKAKKSRKRVFIDSDSDEETATKSTKKKGKTDNKKAQDNDKKSESQEVSKSEVSNLFGKSPIKRVEQPKTKKQKKSRTTEIIEDIDWDDEFIEAENKALNQSVQNGSLESGSSQSPSPSKSLSKKEVKPSLSNQRLHEMSPSPEKELKPPVAIDNESNKSKLIKSESPVKNNDKPTEINTSSNKNGSLAPSFKNLAMHKIESHKTVSPEPVKKKSKPNEKNQAKEEKKMPTKIPTHSPKKTFSKDPVFQLWVDKYKPGNLKQIIGQQGEKSNVNKLVKWLKNWFNNHSGNKKIPRPSPWAKDDSGAFFKAALLSGPPGVGKTTTAHLVCNELGMDVVEFNASDTRSKKLLQQEINDLLSSKTLSPYISGGNTVSRQHVLVMDEVDGMAGNEDRGGVQELIQLIKSSRVPIICMCNDRNHPKIRSLANYCFDLRFSKPRADQIRGAMMSICFKEGLKVKPEVLTDIIVNTNQDIRLILNHLSMLAAQSSTDMSVATKYVKIGPWDVLRKVFSEEEHKSMSIYDKCDLFFYDYNIAPLFVQENYLNVQPHSAASKSKRGKMELFAKAAQSLAYGDLVENVIRSSNAWSLLPVQAVFSSLLPGEYLVGHMGGQINFPAWLGKNSKRGKLDRLSQEIQAHTRLKVSGSKEAINLDYSYVLKEKVIRPLLRDGSEGVDESLSILKEYSLLREDLDSLSELTAWPGVEDPFTKIESKVKSAFTRAYNKNPPVTPFTINAAVKKGRGTSDEVELGDENLEEADDEDEDQDDVSKDAMIMVKKKSSKDETKERKKNESGPSKPRGGSSRGKRGKK